MTGTFGRNIRISLFGVSHGEYIGITADGLPAGMAYDQNAVERMMERRRARGDISTSRHEGDKAEMCIRDSRKGQAVIYSFIRVRAKLHIKIKVIIYRDDCRLFTVFVAACAAQIYSCLLYTSGRDQPGRAGDPYCFPCKPDII